MLSATARETIDSGDPLISPIVRLELQYLHEIRRLKPSPDEVCRELASSVGLKISDRRFDEVVDAALAIGWTRDLFDRPIVAEARLAGAQLVTRDRVIRDHYPLAVW